MNKVNIKEIQPNDIFGEVSYYRVQEVRPNTVVFTHTGSGNTVELSHPYVEQLLFTADQYQDEVSVGLLDKVWTAKQVTDELKKNPKFEAKEGDVRLPGIKTIWSNVGSKPFTVCFTKKGKDLSETAYNKKIASFIEQSVNELDKAKSSKKSITEAATKLIQELCENPITRYEQGEERVLRGIKLQHESPDGYYQVVDLDITSGETKRLVNLNTIKWLVVGGTKYIVE